MEFNLEYLKNTISFKEFERRVRVQLNEKKSMEDVKKFYKYIRQARFPTVKLVCLNILTDLKVPITQNNLKVLDDYISLVNNTDFGKSNTWMNLFL